MTETSSQPTDKRRGDPEYEYFAFISYSRKDRKVASWLQRKLQWFRIPTHVPKENCPKHRRFIRPVYRDRTDLENDSKHYLDHIRSALEKTRYLIVLCSPESAKSDPVDQEIRHFLEPHGSENVIDRVIPVILAGAPTEEGEDGCLPSFLRNPDYQLTDRNLPSMIADDKGSESEAWEEGFIGIVAYLLKLKRKSVGDHIRREERKRANRVRLLAVAMALLTLFALAGFGWALKREKDAKDANELARAQHTATTAAQLALSNPNAGLDLSLEAIETEYELTETVSSSTLSSLLHCLELAREIDSPSATRKYDDVQEAAFSAEGQHLLVLAQEAVHLIDASGVEIENRFDLWQLSIGKRTAVAVSGEGGIAAVGNRQGQVHLWSDGSIPPRQFAAAHAAEISHLSFLEGRDRLLSIAGDGSLFIWDTASGEKLAELKLPFSLISEFACSPSGQHAVVAGVPGPSGNELAIVDLESLEVTSITSPNDSVVSLAISSRANAVIAGCRSGMVRSWTVDGSTARYAFPTGHQHEITAVAFDPESGSTATSSRDRTLRIFDASGTLKMSPLIGHSSVVTELRFQPGGDVISSFGPEASLRRWDLLGLQSRPPLQHQHACTATLYSRQNHALVVGLANGDLVFYQRPDNGLIASANLGFSPNLLASIEGNSDIIAASKQDGKIALIDWQSKRPREVFELEANQAIRSISVDGDVLWVMLDSRQLLKLSADSLEKVGIWTLPPSVPVSTVGKLEIAETPEKAILQTKKLLAQIDLSEDEAKMVLSVEASNPITPLHDYKLAFNSQRTRFITGIPDDGLATGVYSTKGLKLLERYDFGLTPSLFAAAFVHHEHFLAAGSSEGALRLIARDVGVTLGPPLYAHASPVSALIDDEHQGELISAGSDGLVRFWRSDPNEWIEIARKRRSQSMDGYRPRVRVASRGDYQAGVSQMQSGVEGALGNLKIPDDWERLDESFAQFLKDIVVKRAGSNPEYFNIVSIYAKDPDILQDLLDNEGLLIWNGSQPYDERAQLRRLYSLRGHLTKAKWDLDRYGISSYSTSDFRWNQALRMFSIDVTTILKNGDKRISRSYFAPNTEGYLGFVVFGSEDFHKEAELALQTLDLPEDLQPDPEFLKVAPQLLAEEIEAHHDRAKANKRKK